MQAGSLDIDYQVAPKQTALAGSLGFGSAHFVNFELTKDVAQPTKKNRGSNK